MEIKKALEKIWNHEIKEMTSKIYEDNKEAFDKVPASLSKKYHSGETIQTHVEFALEWLFLIMNEFSLSAIEKDYLISATILHDVSSVINASTEPNPEEFQKLYPTGYFRSQEAYVYHPTLSAFVIGKYIIDTKKNIPELIKVAKLIESHMSHWLKGYNPEPIDLLEFILCTSDYLSTRKDLPKMENDKK